MRPLLLLLLLIAPAVALLLGAADAPPNDPSLVEDYPHGTFRGDCRECHDAERWSPAHIGADFDHGKYGWALEGAHENAPCLLCHLDLEFSATAGTDCGDCHDDVHLGELGTDCAECHTSRSFLDRAEDLRTHRLTQFPLMGAHAAVDCAGCHGPGGSRFAGFANTPTECVACHRADFEATTNPPHVGAGFLTDCLQCHAEDSWGGSVFDHSLTGFPLTGAHQSLACVECHQDYVFEGRSADCFACHGEDYDSSTNPNHVASGIPTACAECHGTVAWRPAEFDHDRTRFPLTGAHVIVDCTECHVGGQYTGTPTDCYACHRVDYEATTDPDHETLVLPQNCAECHRTTAWSGARFDGHIFPIYSGAHTPDRWGSCSTCHSNPAVPTAFDCLVCHPHSDRAETDGHHREVGGYAYETLRCYGCHPQGRTGG